MLIDGAVKKYPTAIVDLDTPFFKGTTKVLCMEHPVQDIIIGNIPGALGPDAKNSVVTSELLLDTTCNTQKQEVYDEVGGASSSSNEDDDDNEVASGAAVQTRAMVEKESRPPKPLKVTTVTGLEITTDGLIELQQSDETLKKYRELTTSPAADNNKPQFLYKKRILYRRFQETCNSEVRLQLVVPESLREKVVSLAHDTLLAGHRGPSKTLSRVTQEFYWPGIHNFVSRYVASCDLCQRNVSKGTVGKAPLGKLPLVGTPFSIICIDLVGPLSPPSEGYRYILTTIDMCTRFPEAIPLKDISSSTVAEALVGIFSRVGVPKRIHSDRGSQFTSEMTREVYRLLSVQQSTTSPYHAMGNGVIENFNKTIKNLLKKVTAERPKDWHRYLTPLMFAVRDTPQDSTGFTPFELLYGRSVRTPMTMLKELWSGEVDDPESKTSFEYVVDLRQRLEETCNLAKEELGKVQTRNQKYYNRKARDRKLRIGDSVLLLLPTEHNKLTLAWRGPYKVVETVGNVDYRVEIAPGKVKTYHINMLKQYFHRNKQNEITASPIQSSLDNESETVETQIAAVACVLEDSEEDLSEDITVRDNDMFTHYNLQQKETVDDVVVNPDLSEDQRVEIREILKKYTDIFTDIPKVTHIMEHKVDLTSTEPVRCKAYPIPYKMQEVIDKEITDMLAMGVIERSEAAYASPLVLVKKSDDTYRVCVNFKDLNKVTVFDPEPMMSSDDIFPKLAGSQFYSTFDFSKGYWAIPMAEKSKDYTSFITSRGLMRFRVMPFGMVNAGSTYNRMVRKLLDGARNLESYVDDVIGYTGQWQQHLIVLKDFFERVRAANLSLRPSKCRIGFGKVDFLGHTINGQFLEPKTKSVEKILDTPRPQTKKACRSLIGLVNFYRRYIPNCASILAPVTDLTKGRAPNNVIWGEKQEAAFNEIKRILSSEPILKLPDLSKEFILQTDASNIGIGACLMQEYDGMRHPVRYASKKLLAREQNYSVGEREALAIVWAVSKFHQFIYGQHFILESDHRPLEYISSTHSSNPKVMRWSLALQPYRYTVRYIRGSDNIIADYLSRC
jgi:transposase InsO family protein